MAWHAYHLRGRIAQHVVFRVWHSGAISPTLSTEYGHGASTWKALFASNLVLEIFYLSQDILIPSFSSFHHCGLIAIVFVSMFAQRINNVEMSM